MSDRVSKFLQERIDAGDFPSAVYLVGEKGEVALSGAVGHAVVDPELIPAKLDTIYDLASLTKPIVTGLLIALFIQRGGLSLDDRVSIYLDEFERKGKRMITIRDLVSHRSPLPSWMPFYLVVAEAPEIIRYIGRADVRYNSTEVTYGDPNFIVLGAILERLSGMTIDRLAKDNIFEPLGLKDIFFNPPEELKPRIAASERGNEFEKQTCLAEGYKIEANPDAFRTEVIWGSVHDGNAYFMNGVAGHAGLFSTAADLFLISQQFLASTTSILEPEICSVFTENLTARMNESRSLAFQLAATPKSTAGGRMSKKSFGHLGFSGTSVWIDPEQERVYILLTNRTHDHELPFVNINSVRRKFHDLATEELDNK